MAVKLEDKTNVNAPSASFPYGDVRDNDGGGNGTPVERSIFSDYIQFFHRIADEVGLVYNGALESAANGFQFVDALKILIRDQQATTTQKGTLEIATQAEVDAGTSAELAIVPTTLKNQLDKKINIDGSNQMTADLPMDGNKVVGLDAGDSSGDSVEYDQFQAALPVAFFNEDGDANEAASITLNQGASVNLKSIVVTNTSTIARNYKAITSVNVLEDGGDSQNQMVMLLSVDGVVKGRDVVYELSATANRRFALQTSCQFQLLAGQSKTIQQSIEQFTGTDSLRSAGYLSVAN